MDGMNTLDHPSSLFQLLLVLRSIARFVKTPK
jgi:hypothetical protein